MEKGIEKIWKERERRDHQGREVWELREGYMRSKGNERWRDPRGKEGRNIRVG